MFDDPNAQFIVQGNSTTFNITGTTSAQTSGPQMQYAQYAIGTGNALTDPAVGGLPELAGHYDHVPVHRDRDS